MSEWNLSVKLTGQGSGLARTLRDLSSDARTASAEVNALRRNLDLLRADASNDIRIRLGIDADHLRSDVNAALTTAGSGQGLQVRLDIDAGHLRDDVNAALAAAGSGQGLRVRLDLDADHLRDEVNAALTTAGAGQGLAVNLQLADANQLRRDVANAVRWAAWGHRIEIPIALRDPNSLRNQVSAAVRRAQLNQTIRVRVTTDTGDLNQIRRTLGGNRTAGGGGNDKANFDLKGLLTLAPAAIPLIAGLSTTIAPLAAQFTAAGVAGAAFGLAVAGQIGPLGAVADAQDKYQKAVVQYGATSQQAMEAQQQWRQQLAQLPPATQQAAIALSTLKSDFSDWSDSLAGFTMTPVTKGINILDSLIPRLTPEVQSATKELDRLVTTAGGAVASPGFDAFASRVQKFTDSKLDQLTDEVIHLMRVISSGGAGNGVIASFVQYAKANAPAAKEALSAIAKAVIVLMEGAAQAGPSLLTLVTAAARLVAALPPELVGIILHVAAALKLLQLSGAGMAALAGGLTRVRTAIAGLTAASAGAGGGIAGLRAAFMSLGVAARTTVVVAGIAAVVAVFASLSNIGKKAPPDVDKLTTSLGKLGQTGKTTGEAARSFGKDFSGLADSLRTLSRPSNMDKTQQFLTKLVGMDSTPVADAKKDLDGVDKALANLVQGGKADVAKAAFDQIAAAMKKQGMSAGELKGKLDNYKSALADQKFEQEMAAQAMGLFGQAAQDTQAKLDAQKASADGLRQSIMALNDVNRAAGSAMNAFEQSIDDATKAAKDNAGALHMHNGELDLGSQKSRDAEKALSGLASSTEDAASKAREQGKSWEYVQGILTRGQSAFVETAQKMGLTKSQAEALAKSYLDIPDKKSTTIEMRTEDAIAGLDAVIAAIKKTPNAKSVTVDALTTDAIGQLTDLGYKVTKLPNGKFKISALTNDAQTDIAALETVRDGLKNKTIKLDASTGPAIKDLEAVKAKVASTKGKTITMKAPTAEARKQLEALGFKIRATKGKNVTISVPTGSQRSAVAGLANAIAALRSKTVHVTVMTDYFTAKSPSQLSAAHGRAHGGLAPGYASGGHAIQTHPNGGLITGPGTTTSDSILELSPNGGVYRTSRKEYIVRAPSVDKYGVSFLNALNSGSLPRIPGYAGGGLAIPGYASGGSTFSYTPTGTIKSASDVQSSYSSSHQPITRDAYLKTMRSRANAVDSLRAAEGKLNDVRKHHHTHAQLVAAENRVAKARRTLATATDAARSAESRYKKTFSLADWGKTLASAAASSQAYEKNLSKIASRGGSDVIDQLRDMGAEGATMVAALAKASTKQFNSIVANLRKLGPLAKATLADYTTQLNSSTKTSAAFQANLVKLAGMGYGDLATQLAAQGDDAAQKLAAEAVKSKSSASKANTAAKANANALTGEQVSELVQIISAIKTSKTGIHDVAGTTGIGEDEIITVAGKARSQISSSLGSRATKFLADLARAGQHLSYADGGMRAGLYATRGGIVRFAEPETHGEAYLPLSPTKRRTALPVLADVAHRFGLGLTDARATRPVVIVREGGATHVSVTAVRTGATASDIGAQVGRSVRRARRGGVTARAA